MKKLSLIILLFICFNSIGQTLPDFTFSAINKSELTKENIAKEKPVIIFYFNPTDDHSLKQAEQLKNQLAKLKTVTLIWVAWESDSQVLNEFKNQWFKGAANVFVCYDSEYKIDRWFGYSEALSIFTYNAKWERTAKFSNEISVDELLKAVK